MVIVIFKIILLIFIFLVIAFLSLVIMFKVIAVSEDIANFETNGSYVTAGIIAVLSGIVSTYSVYCLLF